MVENSLSAETVLLEMGDFKIAAEDEDDDNIKICFC
jgi:hypothetical protein